MSWTLRFSRKDGRMIDGNGAFLRIVGYNRDDLISGRLKWRELIPVNCRGVDERGIVELEATGTSQPYEKDIYTKPAAACLCGRSCNLRGKV
jgi:PAS domain-containing protein